MSGASATGIPSQNEDLTLETGRDLFRRLNRDGLTWGEPVNSTSGLGAGRTARRRTPAIRASASVCT